MLLSHIEYERLEGRDREVLTLAAFTEEDRAVIAVSQALSDARSFNDEMN